MKQTTRYRLKLYEGSDRLGFAAINENMETIDRALSATADRSWQVGDIRESTRTDLDSTWALCNGADFDPKAYPTLAAHGPNLATLGQLRRYVPAAQIGNVYGSSPVTPQNIYSLCSGAGWLVVGTERFICATNNDFQTTTALSLGAVFGSAVVNGAHTRLWLANGRWFVYFIYSYRHYLACTSGTNPTTGWGAMVDITATLGLSNNGYPVVHEIWYENGNYWMAATVLGVPKLAYGTDPTFASCTVVTPTSTQVAHSDLYCGFLRGPDKYVFHGVRYINGATPNVPTVCYGDPGSTSYTTVTYSMDALSGAGWTEYVHASISPSQSMGNMLYLNGRYCRIGVASGIFDGGTYYQPFLAYTDNIASSTWGTTLTGLAIYTASQNLNTNMSRNLLYVPEREGCVAPLSCIYTGSGANAQILSNEGFLYIKNPYGAGEIRRGSVHNADETGVVSEYSGPARPVVHNGGIWLPGRTGLTRVPVYALPREGSDYGHKYIKIKEDAAL